MSRAEKEVKWSAAAPGLGSKTREQGYHRRVIIRVITNLMLLFKFYTNAKREKVCSDNRLRRAKIIYPFLYFQAKQKEQIEILNVIMFNIVVVINIASILTISSPEQCKHYLIY